MTIPQLSAALPDQVTLQKVIYSYSHPDASGSESYVDLVIEGGGLLNGTFDGYCIDADRLIDFELDNNGNGRIDANEVGESYPAKIYSSYEALPTELVGPGLIEKPENLDLLNWIINQDFAGQESPSGGKYTFADVQRAIWALIDDTQSEVGIGPDGFVWTQARVDEIIKAAQENGEGFVPEFGQKMGVIIVPETNGDGIPDAQVMFAAVELAQLGDRVFEDFNADGIQNASDTGIAGVTVNLLADNNGDGIISTNEVVASTTTDENGDYSFTVVPGEYKVQFETPAGFNGVSPANQGGNDAIDSDGLLTDVVSLAPGESNPTLDSGFYRTASLGDKVFFDVDRDGIQDAGERGVEGVTVTLTGGGADGVIGTPDDTTVETTTDLLGNYKFEGLNPGEEYKVTFSDLPQEYDFTQPNVGDDAADSDADPATGMSQVVTLSSGEYNSTLDAGIVSQPAALGDRVWYDTDKDGIQDPGEQGVEGIKVTLIGGGADGKIGTADDTTTVMFTDANGNYRFDDLNAGEEYKVNFSDLPQGYGFTQANAADITEEVVFESSFETAPRRGYFVSAPLEGWKSKDGYLEIHRSNSADGRNHIELNDDASNYYKDASQIYRDIQTEAGKEYTLTFQYAPRPGYSADVNAMEVRLDGATLLEAKESGRGQSGFNWKTYTVSFEGDGSTKQLEFLSTGTALRYGRGARLDDIKLVSSMGSNDDTIDSDANPNNGMSQTVVLAPGEYNPTIDAGIIREQEPICAKLVGTTGINEGSQGNYFIQLDEVSDRDRFFTIRIDNGSAQRVDKWAGNQDIMAGGYYDTRRGIGGPLIKKTYGYIPQGRAGDTRDDRIAVGPSDASWDYTIYNNGRIDRGNTVTVKVEAGKSASDSFQVQTWKERVTVDRDAGNAQGYFEGTEQFSMQVIAADADKVCNDHLDISIYDRTHYDFVSPIALDLNGNGIQTLSVDRGITFDLMNTGEKIQTGWLSGDDGFLAIDNNGNGQIDDRSELFGGSVGEGFAKLSSFDSNGDGWVNAEDRNFAQLQVWQDANENALTDQGELMSLAEAGITALNTNYAAQFNLDAQGNLLGERSVALSATGQSMEMIDVYFQVAGTEPTSATVS